MFLLNRSSMVSFVLSVMAIGSVAYFMASAFAATAHTHVAPSPAWDEAATRSEGQRALREVSAAPASSEWVASRLAKASASQDASLPAPDRPTDVDPLRAPLCPDLDVSLVSQFTSEAVALLKSNEQGKTRPRRVGQAFAGYRVVHIGFNYLKASAAVWLTRRGALCQVLVSTPRGEHATVAAREAPTTPFAKAVEQHVWQRRIEKMAPNEFRVDRSLLESVLESPGRFLGRLRPRFTGDSASQGMRLLGLVKGSLLSELGVLPGDLLLDINGQSLSDPEAALVALARLRQADELSVKLLRKSKPIHLHISLI